MGIVAKALSCASQMHRRSSLVMALILTAHCERSSAPSQPLSATPATANRVQAIGAWEEADGCLFIDRHNIWLAPGGDCSSFRLNRPMRAARFVCCAFDMLTVIYGRSDFPRLSPSSLAVRTRFRMVDRDDADFVEISGISLARVPPSTHQEVRTQFQAITVDRHGNLAASDESGDGGTVLFNQDPHCDVDPAVYSRRFCPIH